MEPCPSCERDFDTRRGVKLHHKRTHGESLAAEKVELECSHCGDGFEVYPYRSDSAEYCSQSCRNSGRDVDLGGSIELNCDWCTNTFLRSKSAANHRERDFCSRECYSAWRSEHIVGEKHPRWSGGPGFDYGEGWNKSKKKKVRKRDNYRCCACGMEQQNHKEKFGTALSVHHIRQARSFDNADERNDMENLISLCRPCHNRWEGIPLKPDNRND